MSKQHLLTPYNKILTSITELHGVTRGRADNEGNVPTDELHGLVASSIQQEFNYYRRLASVSCCRLYQYSWYLHRQVEGWKKVTKRVHDKGGKISIVACRTYVSSRFHNGALPLSASAINLTTNHFLPQKGLKILLRQEMTIEDIKTTVKDFQHSAANAVKAGLME
jgi:N-ethylmaleimide reductase